MNASPVIDVQHLRKTYGGTVAVADVSLAVERGEIFGILGPNGSGKTTTVETMLGLRPTDGGRVRVLGLDPHRHPRRLRERVGVQLQQARLPAQLRVGEALELYASFYRNPAEPAELLDLLGLTGQQRTAFASLSGGQQQRLSIALALVGNPEITVLDELTTGLDPQARRTTWDLIERVRARGVTVVLVTHDMDEAAHLCDRLAIIDHGTVVATGSPRDLTAAESAYTLTIRAGTDSLTTAALPLPGSSSFDLVLGELEVTGSPQDLTNVLVALAQHGITPVAVQTRTRTLEDVFLGLAGDGAASLVTTSR
ncbi:ABC transporter ATP-binding protein [Georgenia sp. H159]|uniref:ABC transporter ATP-binding protein n=1 Tax=Georgenia sp. H159 TaxID=3076115 RepID=UPI002D773E58|nr:ABC transporter ATP-binding protein [Georgenia sp. H159]